MEIVLQTPCPCFFLWAWFENRVGNMSIWSTEEADRLQPWKNWLRYAQFSILPFFSFKKAFSVSQIKHIFFPPILYLSCSIHRQNKLPSSKSLSGKLPWVCELGQDFLAYEAAMDLNGTHRASLELEGQKDAFPVLSLKWVSFWH